VSGGDGDDLLVRGSGADRLDGGPGRDRTIDFADFAAGRYATPPGIAPAIDWNRIGALGAASEPTPRSPRQSSWVADFVSDLGRSAVERNPNAEIRLVVPPPRKGT
jgi:hypothetical protein